MRVKNTVINISFGIGNQIIITLLSFISRTVFINTLGVEYLGINGLFTNILAMLSLAEAGIGASIVYSLYKPVAENDEEKIKVLMKLYRNTYLVISVIVLVLGLSIMPFLEYFVKNSSVQNIYLIYLIFLINTASPYLYLHKNSFLNVCQKSYVITGIYSISSILSTCFKIFILYSSKNYVLYLVVDSLLSITISFILSKIVDKMYPFLKGKVTSKLDSETKGNIIKNVKAIVFQNIGVYLVSGTDNIIISTFISIAAVGLYSNYIMLFDICRTFMNQIFNNMYHSIGNLVAKESIDKVYSVYQVYWLLNFWLYSFFTIFLYIVIEPFIVLWIGSSFLMEKVVLFTLAIAFYERGMRNAITTVKTTAGIFHEDRYVPFGQAVINLGLSLVLVRYIGIAGVLLGTFISAIAFPFWTTPYLVYKKVFNKPLVHYFTRYFYFASVGIVTCLITSLLCHLIVANLFISLACKGLIALIIPNVIYWILFNKTAEFKYLLGILIQLKDKLREKYKPARNRSFSSDHS